MNLQPREKQMISFLGIVVVGFVATVWVLREVDEYHTELNNARMDQLSSHISLEEVKKKVRHPSDSSMQIYISKQGFSFEYPDELTVRLEDGWVDLNHAVAYKNTDACDFRGSGKELDALQDFHARLKVYPGTIAEAATAHNPQFAKGNLNGDGLAIKPGFVDPYAAGPYKGFAVTESVEGCGTVTYYLTLPDGRTLVATRDLVGWLADVVNPEVRAKVLQVPGIINTSENTKIFDALLKSVQLSGAVN